MMVYMEIGTADWDTLSESLGGRPSWSGVSAEAVPELFAGVPKHNKNKYVNAVVTHSKDKAGKPTKFYYIPEDIRVQNKLEGWTKGIGAITMEGNDLSRFRGSVKEIEVPSVYIGDLADSIQQDGIIDLVKIDTEGYDAQLVEGLLNHGVKISRITFEFKHVPSQQLDHLERRLFKMGYSKSHIYGDNVTYRFPTVAILAQPDWSTGSIVKDLAKVSKNWIVKLWPWWNSNFDAEATSREVDAVFGMTLTSVLKAKWCRKACTCNLPEEMGMMEFAPIKDMNMPLLGGVSLEICRKLVKEYPASEVMYLPYTARLGRFTFKPDRLRKNGLKKAGFVRLRSYGFNVFFNNLKRPDWFLAICAKAGLEPVFTEKNYTYDTMEDFYNSVDLVICSSLNEGGPLGIFEAIACGVPVISTNVGMVKEFDTIKKFSTVDEGVGLIQGIRDDYSYPERVYSELAQSGLSCEGVIPYWEAFFSRVRSLIR